MQHLYIFFGLLAIGLIYMRFEAGIVEVKRVRFTRGKNYLKILQLSDIHINLLKVSPRKVAGILRKENPDLVILTGDYINKSCDIPEFLNFVDNLKGEYDIYACLGNHDYKAFSGDEPGLSDFVRKLTARRVIVLNNESISFEKGSKKYNIIGIGDVRCCRDDIDRALKSVYHKTETNIAFSHNPDLVLKLPKEKVDYFFCGHFHGGQIWAPFDLEFKTLRNEKLCKMGIKRGLHKVNGINMYINRGLGNVCVPLRFLSRPEITIFYMP